MLDNVVQITGSINSPEKITGDIDSKIEITGSINNQEQGLSAYQIALANGFVGDEKSWLQSLKGKEATINGFNSIEIIEGNNVTIEQEDNKLKINSIGGSGDLSKYALKTEIPTNISTLNNDVGYLISVPNTYKTKTENDELYQPKGNYLTSYTESDPTVPSHVKSITEENINSWNNKSDFSGLYNDLTNKPTIPSKTSDLINNSDFTTKDYVNSSISNIDLSNYALKTEIPTNISTLNNDVGYLTNIPNTYKTKTENDELYQPKGDYLTSYTESDPTVPSHVKSITEENISNWNNKSNIAISDTEPTNEDTKIWINYDGIMKYKNGEEWQTISGSGGNTEPIGSIKIYFGETEPYGYKFVNGQELSRTEYSELFSLIGTNYGAGDESTTFNLPDMSGLVPVGLNVNKSWFNELGKTGGQEEVNLTLDNLPLATFKASGNSGDWTYIGHDDIKPHNNLQPYMVVNYIMKVKNIASEQTIVPDYIPIGTEFDYEGTEVPDGYEEVEKKQKILWTNPNPSEEFDSQEITLSSNDYDVLEVWFRHYRGDNYSFSQRFLKGTNTDLFKSDKDGAFQNREIIYISDKQLSFGDGYFCHPSYSDGARVQNSRCVPICIIGYKTGLFS